jgi:hypothetical protein
MSGSVVETEGDPTVTLGELTVNVVNVAKL